MNIIVLDKSELGDNQYNLELVFDGTIDGLVVKNFFPTDEITKLRAFFSQHASGFPANKGDVSIYEQYNFGAKSTAVYLENAQKQNQLFECDLAYDLNKDIKELFQQITTSSIQIPELDGKQCAPFTVRKISPNAQIPAHVENELSFAVEAYQAFDDMLEIHNTLSYFILLGKPQVGGELVLFDLTWESTPKGLISKNGAMMSSKMRDKLITSNYKITYSSELNEGDMLIFAGGRTWHKVNTVQGKYPRFTIGGFIAKSKTEKSLLYYWS